MKEKIITLFMAFSVITVLAACGNTENTKNAQQENIDRMETSEETTEELTEGETAVIYAAQRLQDALKNPHSLEIYSMYYKCGSTEYYVKIEYAATNSYGGLVEDTFCYEVNDGIFSDDNEDVEKAARTSGGIETYKFNAKDREEIEVDTQRILDNIDMVIVE